MRMKTAKGLLAAGAVLGTLGVMVQPAAAAGGTISVPELVVTAIGEDVDFNGDVDLYSAWTRELVIAGGEDGPQGECDHGDAEDGGAPDDGEVGLDDGCFSVQIDPTVGEVTIVGASGHVAPGGAEIIQDTLPTAGFLNLFGTRDEMNDALAALRWIAPDDYESSAGNDPAFLTVFATDGAEDPIAFQDEDGNPFLDGSNNPVSPMQIEIRAEHDPNEGPDLTIDVVTQPFPVPASTTPSLVDDEVVLSNFDGNGTDEFQDGTFFEDPDLDDDEADDFALFIVWLDPEDPVDANFSLASFSSPDCIYDSIETFLAQTPGELCTVIEEPFAVNFEESMFTGLVPTGLSFGTDIVNERAVIFLARHTLNPNESEPTADSTAENILSRIEFYPPQEDCDCTLSVFVHDLGNNGVPLPNTGVTPQEKGFLYPDLLGFDFESIDFQVRDAENDPPVVEAVSTPVAAVEGVAAPFGFTVDDVDADCAVTLTGFSVAGGTVASPPTVPSSGTPEAIEALLTGLQFTPAESTNHPGAGSVTATVNDNGCGADDSGDDLTDSATVAFTVADDGQPDSDPDTDNNDPPELTAPASIDVVEAVPFALDDAALALADPDAGGDDLTLTITPAGGTTNADGVNTGTLTELNALLDALTFTAEDDADTADELLSPGITLEVSDDGHNPDTGDPADVGTDSATIAVNVDDDDPPPPGQNVPPTITGPTDAAGTEGTAIDLGDFTVADPDVGPGAVMDLTVTFDPAEGTLSAFDGTDITLAQAESVLDGLTFTPVEDDADFADELNIPILFTLDDNGNTGTPADPPDTTGDHLVFVDVTDDDDPPPANEPPVIVADPASQDVVVGATANFEFDITDADDTEVTLTAFTSTCGAVAGAPSVGTTATLATLLDGLSITVPNLASCTVTATISDGEDSDTDTATFDITPPAPNAAPSIVAAPASQDVAQGSTANFAFTITDADDTEVTLTAFTSTCGAVAGAPSVGTTATLATLLDGLSITVPNLASCTVTATISDGEASDTDTATFDITPPDPDNVPPSIVAAPANQDVVVGATANFAFTITDADDATVTLTALTSTCGAVTGAPGVGTTATLATLLDGLSITAPDAASCAVTATISDGAASDTDTATFDITQDPPPDVNEAPTIDGPDLVPLTVVEGGLLPFTVLNRITIADDADPTDELVLTVTQTGGGVSAAVVPGDTTGTLAELQLVLDGLVFTAGAPGAASVTIEIDDQGNTGTGGPLTASLTIPITVTAAQGGTTTTTSTTLGGGGITSTTAGPNVGAGGATRGTGGANLPRTGADLMLLAGAALVLTGVGGLLTGRRARPTTI